MMTTLSGDREIALKVEEIDRLKEKSEEACTSWNELTDELAKAETELWEMLRPLAYGLLAEGGVDDGSPS